MNHNYVTDEGYISFKIYIYMTLIILFLNFVKIIKSKNKFSKEIETFKKTKKSNSSNEKIKLFTKLNTQINRDYLDYSNYYSKSNFKSIFGKNIKINKLNYNLLKKVENIYKKFNNKPKKKVKFSENLDICKF
jgi:hypothetical protein